MTREPTAIGPRLTASTGCASVDRVIFICIGCGARTDSRRTPDDCACGVERSWTLEGPGTLDGSRRRSVCAADYHPPKWQRVSSGDPALDRLLGGGWVLPSAALVWARPKVGKSRLVLRWASKMGPALIVEREMGLELTIATARSAGADLSQLHIREEVPGWQDEAEEIGARVVVFDSIQVCSRWPVSLLIEAYKWARQRPAIVFAISQVNGRGAPNGPTTLEHWPDYPVRVTRRNRKSAVATVELPSGSRFCGPGSVKLPIVTPE